MFSSATPGLVPWNTGRRICSKPLCGGSMEKSISCMPRFSAVIPASSRLSDDVCRDGMRTPITFSGHVVDGLVRVNIGDEEIRNHRLGVSEQLAEWIEDHAVAVEDQLVLTAHGVDPSDEGAIIGGASTHHRLARRALAIVVWGAV